VQRGEDAKEGALLLKKGRRIRPQDIGALAASGITSLSVYTPIRLYVISTGDELVPQGQLPKPGQIRDVNTHCLRALAEKGGFIISGTAIVPDNENTLEQALRQGMESSDIVVVSGGSSKGKKDITRLVFDRVSGSGVFTHGLAVKPGKPAILGYDSYSHTLLVGLPGHPVSAMMVFELLLGWLARKITGSAAPPAIPARVSVNAASSPGKLTCWPCRLEWTSSGYAATPVFGKSGLITTLTQADGYFIVGRDTEGIKAGETAMVYLF
jgi:molybdopterin molybdotransferase